MPTFRESDDISSIRVNLTWPPSTNKAWSHTTGHVYVPKRVKEFRLEVKSCVVAAYPHLKPLTGKLAVIVRLSPPERVRRWDVDNFAGKALLDSLTKAHVWEDDSQIVALLPYKAAPSPRGSAMVTVYCGRAVDTILNLAADLS